MARPAGEGGAADQGANLRTWNVSDSPPRRREQGFAFCLILTPASVYQAHADRRAAVEAHRCGLIDRRMYLHLAMRADERVRAAHTGLPLPRARDRDPEPLEFRRLVRRGEVVLADAFLQRRWEKAARRDDERTKQRLAGMMRQVRNEALARGERP